MTRSLGIPAPWALHPTHRPVSQRATVDSAILVAGSPVRSSFLSASATVLASRDLKVTVISFCRPSSDSSAPSLIVRPLATLGCLTSRCAAWSNCCSRRCACCRSVSLRCHAESHNAVLQGSVQYLPHSAGSRAEPSLRRRRGRVSARTSSRRAGGLCRPCDGLGCRWTRSSASPLASTGSSAPSLGTPVGKSRLDPTTARLHIVAPAGPPVSASTGPRLYRLLGAFLMACREPLLRYRCERLRCHDEEKTRVAQAHRPRPEMHGMWCRRRLQKRSSNREM